MIGTLSPSETIAHLMVTGKLDSCTISIENPFIENSLIDLDLHKIVLPDINIKVINNTPYINISVDLNATISSSGKTFDYTKSENLNKVEEKANLYIGNLLKTYLYKISKDYNSDIVGFGGILSSKYLTLDDFNKVNWNEIFKNSVFDVNVNTKINSSYLFNKE